MMKPKPYSKTEHAGKLIMAYSDTGIGKTTSILATAQEPICYIRIEPRSIQPSMEAIGRDIKIDITDYTDFGELMEYTANHDNFTKYKTVVLDSYTHLMNVCLSSEIEDEAFEQRKEDEKKKIIKELVGRTKMSMEGFGGLSANMRRLTNNLGNLAKTGKIVIVTALLDERPKWDRELAAGPALKGREFPVQMPGFFDLIGLVQSNVKNGKITFPPVISFESPKNNFLAKYTGKRDGKPKTDLPFDLAQILK